MNGNLRVQCLSSLSSDEVQAVKDAFATLPEHPVYEKTNVPTAVGASEWALPALFSVCIVTPYLSGIFKTAGEKTFNALSSAIATATKKLKDHRYQWLSPTGPPLFSPITKIKIQTSDGFDINLVFPVASGEVSEQSLKNAVKNVESVVKEVHDLCSTYEAFAHCRYFLYGYDPATEKWQPDKWQELVLQKARQAGEMPRPDQDGLDRLDELIEGLKSIREKAGGGSSTQDRQSEGGL